MYHVLHMYHYFSSLQQLIFLSEEPRIQWCSGHTTGSERAGHWNWEFWVQSCALSLLNHGMTRIGFSCFDLESCYCQVLSSLNPWTFFISSSICPYSHVTQMSGPERDNEWLCVVNWDGGRRDVGRLFRGCQVVMEGTLCTEGLR